MWGAFQTGFVIQMGARLREAGFGDQPYALTVGSSSGSLVATVAAAGAPFDHDFARNAWIDFGLASKVTRKRLNPHPAALREVFDRGLVDTSRAFGSDTQVVLTAANYDPLGLRHLREEAAAVLGASLALFLAGPCEKTCERLAVNAAILVETGGLLFAPHYFTNKPSLPERAQIEKADRREHWTVVDGPAHLRQAVEASSRIPYLYGKPIELADGLLIDGVFADNAPVELALELGARTVFVVTSSKRGNVFPKPVQSLFQRGLHALLGSADKAARRLPSGPAVKRLRESLGELAKLDGLVPDPRPLDLDSLRNRYPDRAIHVIHPDRVSFPVNRFFESRPEVFGGIYDMGVRAAERALQQGVLDLYPARTRSDWPQTDAATAPTGT